MTELPEISVSVKAAVLYEGQVLLLSYRSQTVGPHYNLPGGKARRGEPLREAARRKVHEETGLNVRTSRLLFVVEYVPELFDREFGPVHKTQHNFLAEITDGNAAVRKSVPEDPRQIGFEWVPLKHLPEKFLLPRVGGHIVDCLSGSRAGQDALVDTW